ncbi:hypothetical protein XaC1_515 [Xanthomonas phage XaC1]|nr:hypothetical protein XaC1_515 [Xanthomonas phage XaC1]
MKVKIKDLSGFCSSVFGGDDFIRHFPELQSTGIEVKQHDGNYYVMIDNKIAHDSCFFSPSEMKYLEEVKNA